MGSAAASNMAFSITVISSPSSAKLKLNDTFACAFHKFKRGHSTTKICAISPNGSVSGSASHGAECSAGDVHKQRSRLESLFCYDKAIPEEIIDKPIGISLVEKFIGNNPRCIDCEAKGAVLCTTCSGSGLYVDSILESQGVIVKVRCLGCGGTGNIMCSKCGGRGHCG
ncbi:PREDICTED: uncharacterized protein LOC101307729 [Fragaria vesca subsp. vesca]|uniref:uncharacterized protein LOC101307729 n=1 Tax=Fragaria vesca subsp. vesca TaxID=101020 RepID=UPI0002C32E77|nr:PREDICTED: uncharacterized protein LOC101307729 [Fragaria vesca subsp. vesca]